MKNVIYIVIIFCSSFAGAQEWRDSLKVARDSYKKEEYSKALKYYQSAQKKAPENIDLSDEMAQSAYKAREFEKAEKIYQQSANSKKTSTDKAKTYHNMGNSRMQKKDYAGAVDSYKEALRNNPTDDQTRYNLSEAIRRLKDEQKKQQQQDKNDPKQNQDDQQKKQDEQNKQNSGKDPQNKPNESQNNSGKGGKDDKPQDGGNPSRLSNKSVERKLDQLTKAEAETKRKMGGSRDESNAIKSGKDW